SSYCTSAVAVTPRPMPTVKYTIVQSPPDAAQHVGRIVLMMRRTSFAPPSSRPVSWAAQTPAYGPQHAGKLYASRPDRFGSHGSTRSATGWTRIAPVQRGAAGSAAL